ncbi:MAG TPA: AlkA N-terminal domain-containing protein [Streptosporangiaceae bacterium]|jgi:AraC family transcriptional regulator of adaptative response / DNA-3-methyladenine glycosylase II
MVSHVISRVPTGIYCRPGRADEPETGQRFPLLGTEAAGLRACHHCRSDVVAQPPGRNAAELLCRAVRMIVAGALDQETEAGLARRLGVSGRHLRRLFMAHLGVTADAIARSSRAHFARRLLDDTELPVTDIAFIAGFGSVRQFNRECRHVFRATPTELRARRSSPARNAADGGLTLRLQSDGPLDWAPTAYFLAARAIPGVEHVDGLTYRRTIVVEGDPGVLELGPGNADHLLLRLHLPHWSGLTHVAARARLIGSLDDDLTDATQSLAADPVISPLLAARPGVRVPGAWDAFEVGAAAIIGQQVTPSASLAALGRLARRFGQHVPGLSRFGLTHTFPAPCIVARAQSELASIGLNSEQAATLSSYAAAVNGGELTLDSSAEPGSLLRSLTAIRGLAASTANYIALRMGDPDAYPAADPTLRHALSHLAPGHTFTTIQNWRPWRAYATAHMWAASSGAVS